MYEGQNLICESTFAHERKFGNLAIASNDRCGILVTSKSGFCFGDIVGHDEVEVLGREFVPGMGHDVLCLSGEPDEELICSMSRQSRENIRGVLKLQGSSTGT
jgi:hypothetical protein